MKAETSVVCFAVFLLISKAEALFLNFSAPGSNRQPCVTAYGYCTLFCPGCRMCYDNLLACNKEVESQSFLNRLAAPFRHCMSKLDECKRTCDDCSRCYADFLDCSNDPASARQPEHEERSSGPEMADVFDQPPQDTPRGAAFGKGEGTSDDYDYGDIDESLKIRLPGKIVFVVDDYFKGAAVEIKVKIEEMEKESSDP